MIRKRLSNFNSFKSDHVSSVNSTINRYIILSPDFDKVDEIKRNFLNIYNKIYNLYGVRRSLKFLTATNNNKNIRNTSKSNSHYSFYIP